METKPYESNFVLMELCLGRCLYNCFRQRSFAFIFMSIGGFTSIITFIVTHLVSGPPLHETMKMHYESLCLFKDPKWVPPLPPFIYENRL